MLRRATCSTHWMTSQPSTHNTWAPVGTILCFLVETSRRGRGIARQLLEAACDGLRKQGLRIAEANPRTASTSAAENHFGPLTMYLSAGFTIAREDDGGSVWVRRHL